MPYSFNPESFIAPATSPEAWSQQQTSAIIGAGEAFAQGMQRREQKRQFDVEQARLADNELARRAEHQQNVALQERQMGLQEQQLGLQSAKFGYEQDQAAMKREQEGLAIIQKALVEAETVEEANAIAEQAGKEYGIDLEPRQARQMMAGSADAPPPPGAEFDAQEDRARNQAEQRMLSELPEGGGRSADGQAASQVITDGATDAAEQMGVPTDLGTTGNAELPKVDEAMKAFGQQRPVIALELESQQATRQQLAQSHQARIQRLQTMPLTPQQQAMAANLSAAAHGLPEAPLPPAPEPGDPNAPPGAEAGMEVTLPPEVAQAMMEPPQLPRDVVRDGVTSGGYTLRSRRTGAVLGDFDWQGIQDARREKRRKMAEPIIGMASDPRDRQMLQAAADSYIESGDEQAYKLVSSFLVNKYREQSGSLAVESQNRLGTKQLLEVQKLKNDEKETLAKEFERKHGVKDMREKITNAESVLARLASLPEDDRNVLEERAILNEFIAASVGRRSTDKDVDRALGNGLAVTFEEWRNRFMAGGGISNERIKEMGIILRNARAYEKSREDKLKGLLYQDVLNSETLQKWAPENIDAIGQEVVNRVFEGSGAPIRHNVSGGGGSARNESSSTSVRASGPGVQDLTENDIDALLED